MIEINNQLAIDENELRFETVQGGGPGGQNVNKVATAVVLRFDVMGSVTLPESVKQRLIILAGKRMTREGELVIRCVEYRSQLQNREAALDRFIELLKEASKIPVRRRPTRMPRAAHERRLAAKKQLSQTKKMRRSAPEDWDQ